ncbi:MAG: hypothetical protein LBD31_04135 [Treponema sp.]|jgi:formate C-acetyltransferase|nr:hypothetical protein [Treponema sp.]
MPNYAERINYLRERKLAQTREKIEKEGGLNEDDYGRVAPPENFTWKPTPNHENGSFYGYEGWSSNFYDLLSRHPVAVDPMDAFAGKWMFFLSRMKGPIWPPQYGYDHLKENIEKYNIIPGIGFDAHFAPDYEIGLSLGWGGLLKKIEEYRIKNAPECAAFYDAEKKTLEAIQLFMRRTVSRIQELYVLEGDPGLKQNLDGMLKANINIITEPPKTLREACQWICWFNMVSRTYNRDGAGGQIDQILLPYYEQDIAAGRITDEDAVFFFACLLLNDTHYYQLGGPDEKGKDITNHVSYLILEGARMINSSCNITIRVHEGLDRAFFLKSVQYLFKNGNAWPRYSGDKALVEGFMRCGYPAELARKRIAVGCNWMSLPGLEYTMNDLVKINMAKVFETAFWEMVRGKKYSTSILWDIFARHTVTAVETTGKCIDFHLTYQVHNEPELVLNLLSHGPVERGLDASCGGAQFYNMAIDGAGIATVSNAFAALHQQVELNRNISWEKIIELIENNYAGTEGEYYRSLMDSTPKYGAGNNAAEEYGIKINKLFTGEVRGLNKVYPGRNFIPGWFSWANTLDFGRALGPTPDGRRAGEAINHGANPSPKFRFDGAVTAMSSIITRVQPGYGNTAPIQLELDPGIAGDDESIQKMAAMIWAMFEQGATLLNINLIDKKKVLEAHKNPLLYPDLVVRVTGFTAYFSMLSPDFRQLVVDRIIAGTF